MIPWTCLKGTLCYQLELSSLSFPTLISKIQSHSVFGGFSGFYKILFLTCAVIESCITFKRKAKTTFTTGPVAETILKCMHWCAGLEFYFCAITYAERGPRDLTLLLFFYFFFGSFFLFFTGMWPMHTTSFCIHTPLDLQIADSFVRYRTSQSKLVSWQLYISPSIFKFWFSTPLNNKYIKCSTFFHPNFYRHQVWNFYVNTILTLIRCEQIKFKTTGQVL